MNYIISAKYIKDYKINVVFNDNKSGVVDLESVIKNDPREIFQELKDLKKFRQIKADMDTIIWDNGLDLAPESLYELLLEQNKI
jgi:hypothetical protein